MRDRLPGSFEEKYKSEKLKELIADEGMWTFIPGINYVMNSPQGRRRLNNNHDLFSFIDKYFGTYDFAFEPNMQDGRYVFLPDNVTHQGIGICASNKLPGFLEVGHFWYPCEYTKDKATIGPGQVYVPMFCINAGTELADMVKNIYFTGGKKNCCTFPFETDLIVTLEGNFLDNVRRSAKIIRDAVKDRNEYTKKCGEALIYYMEHAKK